MHRISKIGEYTELKQWDYISNKMNIADMCTQVSPFCDLHPESLWINGLSFLYETTCQYFWQEKINYQTINVLQSKKKS